MDEALQAADRLLGTSPVVLSLIVALAVVGLAAFAIWVVHAAHKGRDRQ